jgi:hypothetical protein
MPMGSKRTWGNAIEWRILSQPSVVFRKQYKYGCINDPYIIENKKTAKADRKDNYDWPFHEKI